MGGPILEDARTYSAVKTPEEPPPTPPYSDDNASASCEEEDVEIPLPPPSTEPTQVLQVDKNTPDAHVPRDPRLIRLTGVHPFNVEAPLSALFDQGFLTSPELFYVRNHGAVPEVRDEDIPNWEFTVDGLVEKPLTITLRELVAEYEQITSPITLVCAGNRRKEQNQVKKTKGFSWGAAGVSTALFTGVAMSEVIKRARPKRRAKYVCMEGADKLPNGYYGTSVKLNWVMDPNKGMMLAYKMNGEMLRPDHGKPLRAVIPGQIGGRSVKWLKKVTLTASPSDNWYHIYDNRVLPTLVTPEESANNKKWWMDERYAIFDLSVNSAAAYPAHDEKISIANGPEKYRAQGYAYSGGGRRVTRVEISLDKGATWRLSDIDYPEDRYRESSQQLFGGRLDMTWRESCFCWCLWSLDIPVAELSKASDLLVRAMDDSMSVQPRDMYWSVLGMMNNPWFRVTITKEGEHLRFEHPTLPASMPGGWMEKVKKAGGNLTNGRWGESAEGEVEVKTMAEPIKEVIMTQQDLKRVITIDELREHEDKANPWFVLNGEVYEGLSFMNEHPGGAQSIISAAGLDTSDEFMAIHSDTAKGMMPKYHIGTLDEASRKALGEPVADDEDVSASPTFLNARTWKGAALLRKRQVSSDTFIFTFSLGHPAQNIGLPTGQHLMIRVKDPASNESVIRPYTPISPVTQQGTMDVLIKLYLSKPDSKYPAGKMSQAISAIPIGHNVDFKGPIGKFTYLGKGRCSVNERERQIRKFVMICGGSGITPIFQVFRAVMSDPDDPTVCTVLNGNRLVEDVLCHEDLLGLTQGNEHRAEVVYTLSQPPPQGWSGLKGRIDKDLVGRKCSLNDFSVGAATVKALVESEKVPVSAAEPKKRSKGVKEEGNKTKQPKQNGEVKEKSEPKGGMMALICGPEPLENAVHGYLKDMGWAEDDILFF